MCLPYKMPVYVGQTHRSAPTNAYFDIYKIFIINIKCIIYIDFM
jgi:hypothetical protein